MGGSESKQDSPSMQIIDQFVTSAESGDVERLREVLTSGLPINAPGAFGYGALIGAIRKKKIEIIKELLSLDAIDVNVRCSKTGKSALMFAVEIQLNEAVDLLISRKPKLDDKDIDSEWSALHYASYNNNLQAVASIIEAGGDINIQDCSNQTALHIACYTDNVDVIKYLLSRGVDFKILDNEGLDAFNYAETDAAKDVVLYYMNNSSDNRSNV